MSKQPNAEPGNSSPPEVTSTKNAAILLLGDTADTAWRMFIPTIGATLLGLYLDKQFHSSPWVMIISMIFGVIMAGLLVKRQLQSINSRK